MKKRNTLTRYSILFFAVLSLFTNQSNAQSSDVTPQFSINTFWRNKYVTEGRDNLENGGITSAEAIINFSDLALGAWYAVGDNTAYRELNLTAEFVKTYSEYEFYIAYTRLAFLEEDTKDNELSTGISFTGMGNIVPTIKYVYSTEAKGAFVEISIQYYALFLNNRLVMSPYLMEGFDFGYATNEYDGPNNFQVGIESSFLLTNKIELIGHIAHSFAHEDIKRDNASDVTWGAIGVSYTF